MTKFCELNWGTIKNNKGVEKNVLKMVCHNSLRKNKNQMSVVCHSSYLFSSVMESTVLCLSSEQVQNRWMFLCWEITATELWGLG